MVVDGTPKTEKPIKPDDVRKEELLNELRKESAGVVELACLYAKCFETLGVNVTETWDTARKQMKSLQEVYNAGYEDGFYERRRRLANDNSGRGSGRTGDSEGHQGGNGDDTGLNSHVRVCRISL